ncbi:MAG: 3-oxoacyl-ACP reductase [Panacagrimonas sp.]
MSDRFLEFTQTAFGRQLSSLLGLPAPPRLRRASGPCVALPLAGCKLLLGGSPAGELSVSLIRHISGTGAELFVAPEHSGLAPIKAAAAGLGVALKGEPLGESFSPGALVFDASGLQSAADLRSLYDFLQPRMARLSAHGRVLLVSRAPQASEPVGARTASVALRGFVRSLGKEIGRKGSTVNLIEVQRGGQSSPEPDLAGVLRFFLTGHAAFITGQVLSLGAAGLAPEQTFSASLAGRLALVTGAARGIGAAIAQTLAREGAQVIGMDRPADEGVLGETMSRIGGRGLALDVTAKDAAERILSECGPLDVIVHNAGVTRDKMLRNMAPHLWDTVLDINLGAIMRINERLLDGGLKSGARIVCISSIGGIGGNPGQTNYAATKAGIIGYVDALAPEMARRGGAINAVAPGFIETQMTAAMPLMNREVGRRLNSLSQGGLPVDIAEAVTFLASRLSGGVNGQTLRVCGQSFIGA